MKKTALLLASLTMPLCAAPDETLVRSSEPMTPAEELAALSVPEGFEINLFAAEPMINKPINISQDDDGRLWVSSTVEYPYAAKRDRWVDPQGSRVRDSRDAIKILEDTDGDGRADKVTDFADGLNIPTGVLPWHKPEHQRGCIAWSIPNIWYFADTTGDGRADHREVLFGPLGFEKDTHGMCSSFTMGPDRKWVYATHGFNNTSTLRGKDGTEVHLHSGNVFRFKPDGSSVEVYTRGQVNPFGLTFDKNRNLYSADCHSSPVYQLLHGGVYPSFGKPHDGLGFAPKMIQHTHGSTGICGITYIDRNRWGTDWDDHILLGNPVTSRVNLDRIEFHGTTPVAVEKPDFITSKDPWFRPVDLCLGNDGALYVADFYNRIIGHYEVPLDHPGRDRERGRIWRVTKKERPAKPRLNYTPIIEAEIPDLASENPSRRRAAAYRFQQSPIREALVPLLKSLGETPEEDTHLRHVQRMAIRDHLIQFPETLRSHHENPFVLDIAPAVPTTESAAVLAASAHRKRHLTHIARHAEPTILAELTSQLKGNGSPAQQLKNIEAIQAGLDERGQVDADPQLIAWAQNLAEELLTTQGKKDNSKALAQLAQQLKFSAPIALREQLQPFLPPAEKPIAANNTPADNDDVIVKAITAFKTSDTFDHKAGAKAFMTNCAACHQVKGKGGLIGPQLDGIGVRGVERLCEDILDPNRNVDAHFFLTQFKLKDGSELSAFVIAERGKALQLRDLAGNTRRLPLSSVKSRKTIKTSLMPATFSKSLSPKQLNDLLAWLIEG